MAMKHRIRQKQCFEILVTFDIHHVY